MLPAIGFVGGIAIALAFVCKRLGSWYIDDAAISLSYARNLARGIGLVAQFGDAPVEGFSNPLWVFLESLVMKFAGWYSLAVPRTVTIVLLAALVVHMLVRYWRDLNRCCAWLFALLLSVLQPAISIWAMSGLENGLLLFLAFELLMLFDDPKMCRPYVVSCFAAAMAMTRPDAILFAAAFPIFVLIRARGVNKSVARDVTKSLVGVVVVYGGYLLFRRCYFGEWVPNTYFAKALPTMTSIYEILILGPEMRARLFDALFATFGTATPWALVVLCVATFCGVFHARNFLRNCMSVLIVFCIAAFCYAYLPNDWMPYYRFATVFFVGIYVMISMAVCLYVKSSIRILVVGCLMMVSIFNFYCGVTAFVKDAPISVNEVERRGAYFKEWAQLLGLDKPLVMTADAGGILWDESVYLLDLGMLCDATISKCLGEYRKERDVANFWDYVFEVRKPDFIATRAYHSYISDLRSDPRFERDYVPIHQYIDTWILNRYGCVMYSGDYVRRHHVEGREESLKRLRNLSKSIMYPFDFNLLKSEHN